VEEGKEKKSDEFFQQFLIKYREAMIRVGVKENHQEYWLGWVKKFLEFENNETTAIKKDAVDAFIGSLKIRGYELWKLKQAQDALHLYESLEAQLAKAGNGIPTQIPDLTWEQVTEKVANIISVKHYSQSTLKNYIGWIERFRKFLKNRAPATARSSDAVTFLEHIAIVGRVSASSQNVAFNALLFLYKQVLGVPFENMQNTLRAKRPRFVPEVLSVNEVKSVIECLVDPFRLCAELLYGCGLRLEEGLNLRLQDILIESKIVRVKQGKGAKDRQVPLPDTVLLRLQNQIKKARELYTTDMKKPSYDGVFLPEAVENKYQRSAKEIGWYWLFPGIELTKTDSGNRRYHLHATRMQKELQDAIRDGGIMRKAGAHTLRHSFATHLLRLVTISDRYRSSWVTPMCEPR